MSKHTMNRCGDPQKGYRPFKFRSILMELSLNCALIQISRHDIMATNVIFNNLY